MEYENENGKTVDDLMPSLAIDLLTAMSHKLRSNEVTMNEMMQFFQMMIAYVTPRRGNERGEKWTFLRQLN